MSYDPVIREHQEWLGFLQPFGLVVSPAALKNAQARVTRIVTREQEILVRHTHEAMDANGNIKRRLNRFTEFAKEFWSWEDADLATPPDTLSTALQEYGEILRPDLAVPGVKGESEWQILIQELPASAAMDQGGQAADERSWQASPQARFERLLRDTSVPIGLLIHPDAIRLVYAPRGETAGHITFPIEAVCETAGRPMVAALHLLLDAQRLFALPKDQRLPAILQASRKYQNEVSIQLAGQVLQALNELCRGFNDANRATGGELLGQSLKEAPENVYGGLLTTLMRLVFLLYAEDRNLMASDETYQRCYSVIGLHEKLRADAAAYPDTMDQRFGAWAQLLTLSRLVHDGGGHRHWRLPARRGRLFDPDCYPFLEGRPYKSKRGHEEKLTPPKVFDGVLYRVLEDLLYLEGERISYRALDVEQIGSVYEAMMGFEVKQAEGPSIGFKPDHVVVNLEIVLAQTPGDRKKWLKENVGWEPSEKAAQALHSADSTEEILSALNSRISPLYTDRERGYLTVATGDIYLQPTEERRRSGSHYTPRSLTEPIVRTTLDPVLQQLGENPTPEQILNLKVCDPAMGSGAFLVEACRYLGDVLVKAWAAHQMTPDIPVDQDPLLHGRRIVAQRCLYGVDKNPFAVDLAKLSLWLATFAKDHPFTFLDHSFRNGDSLVGLSVGQMVDAVADKGTLFRAEAERQIASVMLARRALLDQVEHTEYANLETHYANAVFAAQNLRDLGDLIVAAFFAEDKAKASVALRNQWINAFEANQFDVVAAAIHGLRSRLIPFHWEAEFPEVFQDGGFHALVGNPPFLGGSRISTSFGGSYLAYLLQTHPGSHGNGDLVAHFFRRGFNLLRSAGTLGFIATNTIAQGDTRSTGLRWLCGNGAEIYAASRRVPWPGLAAVIISIVHLSKSPCFVTVKTIDSVAVQRITAYLVPTGGNEDPSHLRAMNGLSFAGSKVNGKGFVMSPAEAQDWFEADPSSEAVIRPYIDGDDLNTNPGLDASSFVICFQEWTLVKATQWPQLVRQLEETVREKRSRNARTHVSENWWQFEHYRARLYEAVSSLPRVLACSQTAKYTTFAFLPPTMIYNQKLNLFLLPQYSSFALVQCRVHESWALFFGSTMKDDPVYTPTDCFETFPFPPNWNENDALGHTGEEYYRFRAYLMVRNNEGLTKTYNRFHDKYEDDAEIQKLRDLHAQMDRAVLDAYGWTDLQPVHNFILDYQEPDEELDSGKTRKKKEPWRYRWTDEFRDEVLARLLELNGQRAEEERLVAQSAKPASATKTQAKKKPKAIDAGQRLLGMEET
jgi:hypothetical protein